MNNSERHLADILAALLRIEAKMDAAKVADSDPDATTYWVKRLSQPVPIPNADVSKLPGIKRVIGDPPHAFIGSPPDMPDPPIAPVGPQTTWQGAQATAVDPEPRRFMHGGWIHATGFSMVGP